MDKKILVDIYREQIRVALLENNRVAELYIEDDHNQRLIGAIYRGKVQNVLQGMNVAFVDIGLEKNAFLYVADLNTDTEPFQFKGDDPASHQKISHKNMQIADHLKIELGTVKSRINRAIAALKDKCSTDKISL